MLKYLHEISSRLVRRAIRMGFATVHGVARAFAAGTKGRLRPFGAATVLLGILFAPLAAGASGAPVFDAGSDAHANVANTVTASHIIGSGSNRILWATVFSDSGDSVTSVTFNSAAMTQEEKLNYNGSGRYLYVYCLVNPPTGTYNLTANFSVSTYIEISGLSFSNAKQTCTPDAAHSQGGSSAGTTITDSVTTVSNNDMAILVARNDGGPYTAGTNSTANPAGISSFAASFYSTNPQVTPGTMSMAWSYTSAATNYGDIIVAFSPVAAAPVAKIYVVVTSWVTWIF